MKKIPTLFERVFENHKKVGILPNVTPGMEWVLEGEGIATEKMDGVLSDIPSIHRITIDIIEIREYNLNEIRHK